MSGYAAALSSRAIIGRFFERLAEIPSTWVNDLCMTISSDQESETYKWLGMVPAVREWKGGRLAQTLRTNGMTIENKTWEETLDVDIDDLRRDKTGQILVRVDEMPRRFPAHIRSLVSTLIVNGAAATSGLCYDGQYFFDTDHSEGVSGSQYNVLAAAQVPQLAVAVAARPTPAEMAAAILGVIAYMLGYVDDQGEPMNEDAQAFAVMVPLSLYPPALAACTQPVVLGAGGTAAPNPLLAVTNGRKFTIDVIPNQRLTAASWSVDFCVFRTDGVTKPFIFQEELGVQMSVLAEGSDLAVNENKHRYAAKAIYNAGYGMWQHAAKATLSAA